MRQSTSLSTRRFSRKHLVQHEIVSDQQQREWIAQHRDENLSEELRTAARNKLVTHNLRIVDMLAHTLRYDDEDADDLFQNGTIGLLNAIRVFNPSLGTPFATYAAYWIKAAIRAERIRNGRRIHIPSDVHDFWRKTQREIQRREVRQESLEPEAIYASLVQRGGYHFRDRFKKPAEQIKMIQYVLDGGTTDALRFSQLADSEGSEDPETRYVDSYGFQPVHRYEVRREIETHLTALRSITPWYTKLPNDHRTVFALRYGLDRDGTPRTYPEVAVQSCIPALSSSDAQRVLMAS
jgi:RNA polymerase sigma factor (sigma-70 family)